MKRSPDLVPLSEHHHHALVQALEIRRAAEAAAGERRARLRTAAESLVHFWDENGRIHFREEEEVLLPVYARHKRLDSDAAVMRMLADHAEIRAAMEELRQRLARGEGFEAQVVRAGQMLHDHVRLEEDEIFPRIEAVLGESELHQVGPHLTRLHAKTR